MRVKFYKATKDDKWSFKDKLMHNGAAAIALCYQWLLVLLHRLTSKRKHYKYEISICMIFRDEGAFLKEWIEYHRLIGVDHFYLYNNLSEDNYKQILQPYIDEGVVTLIEWPIEHPQLAAYADCYKKFSSESHWIAYIDADEFINLQRDNSMADMLRRYRYQPALQLQWRDFGTSGHIKAEAADELITERYVAAWPWLCNVGKTIINNDFKFKRISVHYSVGEVVGIPVFPVNDIFLPAPYYPTLWTRGIGKTAYINHYFSKSYEWYIFKDKIRTSVLSAKNAATRKRADRFEVHELNNYSHDYSIQRWLVLLKLRMKG